MEVHGSVRHRQHPGLRRRQVGHRRRPLDRVVRPSPTAERLEDSTVTATIDATSIDTGAQQRDDHIRTADFFAVETHPEWTFRSTGITADGDDHVLAGELTLKGVTKPVRLALEPGGFGPDAWGGFTATTTINRSDFGVDIALPLDGGGVVVGEKVGIELEVEGVLRSA